MADPRQSLKLPFLRYLTNREWTMPSVLALRALVIDRLSKSFSKISPTASIMRHIRLLHPEYQLKMGLNKLIDYAATAKGLNKLLQYACQYQVPISITLFHPFFSPSYISPQLLLLGCRYIARTFPKLLYTKYFPQLAFS